MNQLVRIDRATVRLWICGRRIHHGAVGVVATAIGVALAFHDRSDARQWFRA